MPYVRTDETVLFGTPAVASVGDIWEVYVLDPVSGSETVQLDVTKVTLNFDRESDIKTTCSITAILQKSNNFYEANWYNQGVRVWNRHWDCTGTIYTRAYVGDFVINSNSVSYDASSSEVTFSCSDLTACLMSNFSGALSADSNGCILKAGINTQQFVIDLLNQFSPIQFASYSVVLPQTICTLPYDLEFEASMSIWDIIAKIRDLLPNLDAFITCSASGNTITRGFVFTDMNYDWETHERVYADGILQCMGKWGASTSYDGIINSIDMYGRNAAVWASRENEFPTSPYNVENFRTCKKIVSNDLLTTTQECSDMAEYELFKCMESKNTVSVEFVNASSIHGSMVNLLNIQENIINNAAIEFTDYTGETNKYLINQMSYSDSIFNVTASPFTPAYFNDYRHNPLPTPNITYTIVGRTVTFNCSYGQDSGVIYYVDENDIVHSEVIFKFFLDSSKIFIGERVGEFVYTLPDDNVHVINVQAYDPDRACSEYTPITVQAVYEAPLITTASLADGTVGVEYAQTLTASGETPITWAVTSGTLPIGLTLTGDTISGTPTTEGTSTITITATNTAGSDNKQFSLTIASASTSEILVDENDDILIDEDGNILIGG